ncbi:hypothetical protein GTQ40_11320 [Flavobacteriaceae bacterium R38]|nr:hypothetical protein [Flavobacteriaceae bacterium R38]
MKKCISVLVVILILNGCNINRASDLWLNDFELLKNELTTGYANLSFAVKERQIDIKALNNNIKAKLKLASSKKEAQNIIGEFLGKFQDGHLKARLYDNLAEQASKSVPPSNTDSIDLALKKMKVVKTNTGYHLQYDLIKGFKSLVQNQNPFKASIIKSENMTIGILRIPSFSPKHYWEIASNIWKEYQKELQGECKEDCQEAFIRKVENKLTNYVIERIEELNSEKTDALLIDISGNGGGTEWMHQLARLFTKKELKGPPMSFVKHLHWKKTLKSQKKLIEKDLQANISETLKNKLKLFNNMIDELIENTNNNCIAEQVWEKNDIDCLDLISHPFNTELPYDIMNDPQFHLLASKQLIGTARFHPFKKGIFSGPLYIAINRGTASASEGFASLFQFNNAATLIGKKSYGVGCGYTNGGIQIDLKNIGLTVYMPDCVRFTKYNENELKGISPDIAVNWTKEDTMSKRGQAVIDAIIKDYLNQNNFGTY